MPEAYIDRVDDLGMNERMGVIRSLTRKMRVIYKGYETRPIDFAILDDALTYAPPAKSPMNANTDPGFANPIYARYANLYLVERIPQVVEGQNNVVDIVLKYEHFMDGPYQLLTAPVASVYGRGRCSMREKTTNFFYPLGDHTKQKTQILVGHTFQKNDTGIVGCTLDPSLPFTVIQGGEVNLPFPESNYKLSGYCITNDPFGLARQFVAKVNDDVWLGEPAYTWICSEVSFEIMDLSLAESHEYKFEFEWQHNVDTWFPSVVFNDQRTGRPPADVLFATTRDNQQVLRLVNNPYLAAQVANQASPDVAGKAAGQAIGQAVANAAIQAARDLIAAAGSFPPDLAAQVAATQAVNDVADTSSANAKAGFGGVDPLVLDGGQAGSTAGLQAAAAAANQVIADALAAGPPDPGLQAVALVIPDIIDAAIRAGSAEGAAAGANAMKAQVANKLQPAGIWQVPALEAVNFNRLLVAAVEQ